MLFSTWIPGRSTAISGISTEEIPPISESTQAHLPRIQSSNGFPTTNLSEPENELLKSPGGKLSACNMSAVS